MINEHDHSHTTGGLGLEYQKWNFGTTYTYTDNDADEANESFNGNVFQSSVGYYLGSGVGLDFGYKSQDKDNKTIERIRAGIKNIVRNFKYKIVVSSIIVINS